MRDLILTNKVLKALENAEFFTSKIFISKKHKNFDGWFIDVYEPEKDGEYKINLTHHKKAQAIATLFDVGMMICVSVDRVPYYYFY